MPAYYLSFNIAGHDNNKAGATALKTAELAGYILPVILGLVPISSSLHPLCMIVTVIGTFTAIAITFAGKGVQITNDKINGLFGYLGTISLPIYLIHPVVLEFADCTMHNIALGVKMITVFSFTILLSVVYQLIAQRQKAK